MAEYDGSFDILTGPKLDPKKTRQFASDLKKEMQDIVKSLKTDEITDEMQEVVDTVEDLISKMDTVDEKMKALENTRIPTQAFIEATATLTEYQSRVERLTQQLNRLKEEGKGNTQEAQRLSRSLKLNQQAVEKYKKAIEDLKAADKAYTPGDQTEEYREQAKVLEDLANKTAIAKNRLKEMQTVTTEEAKAVDNSALATNMIVTALRAYAKVLKDAATKVKNLVASLFQLIKKSIVTGIQRLGNAIGGLGKHADNSTFSFGRLFRTLLAYGIGINTLTSLFNRMRNAISAGLSAFAEMDNGINIANATLSEFTSSLNYLRNSVAAAFLPIIQVVQPILTSFIDKLAESISYVGAFVRAFLGFSTYAKANKVEKKYFEANNKTKQENAKTTAKNTTKTKANTKAQLANTKAVRANSNALKKQKDVLAGFDDLDVLGREQDNENVLDPLSNLAKTPTQINPNDITDPVKDVVDNIDDLLNDLDKTFQEHADIPDWIKNLVAIIKEFLNQNDWRGLGEFIASKFNGLLQIVDDWFNDVLRPQGVKWAGRIAEFLNGIVAGLDWELLGKTIADGINAVFDIVNTFLTTFDFLEFGASIGRGIKSWFDNIEWDLIGQTFANYWNALIRTIKGIVTTPGIWESIGLSIATFLKNMIATLDVGDLIDTIVALVNGIFTMIKTFLDEYPFQDLASKISYGLNKMVHEVKWAEIGKTLSDLVIQLLDVFLKVAEDTDWYAFGKAIGDFLGSIDWVGILTRVGQIIFEVFSGVIAGLFSTDSGKVFLALLAGLIKLKFTFSMAQAILLPALQQGLIAALTKALVGGMGGAAAAGSAAVGTELAATSAAVTATGTGILATVTGFLASIGEAIAAFIAFLFTPQGLILLALAALLTGIVVAIWNNWDVISEKLTAIGDWLGGLWNSLVTAFRENFTMSIIDELKDMVNTGIKMIEDFVNGIIAGINMAIYALNQLSFDIPDWIPIIGGQHLGFNIPYLSGISIPKLAQGAVIPPNKQFLAMLGDQTSGTNIEAPLDTIVDAFREVVGNMQVQNTGYSEMVLDGQVFARLATPYVISELNRRGYDVKVLEA